MTNKEFIHQEEGYNLKFNDLSAALGLAQFKKIEERKRMLLEQRTLYEEELRDTNEVKLFDYNTGEIPLWIDAMVKDRDGLAKYLRQNEIYSRECWPALHMNPPYKEQGCDKDFPIATSISNNSLWLPNGPAITEKEIKYISEKIREFYKK